MRASVNMKTSMNMKTNIKTNVKTNIKTNMKKNMKTGHVALCIIAFLIIFALAMYLNLAKADEKIIITKLDRPTGKQATEYEIKAVCGEDIKDVVVTVDPKAPTKQELDVMFDEAYKQALIEVLGKNENLNSIGQSLNLINEIESLNMGVVWHISDYELIDSFGDIHPQDTAMPVYIEVVFRYRGALSEQVDSERSYEFQGIVAAKQNSFESEIDALIADENRLSVEKDYLNLPKEYEHRDITYYVTKEGGDYSFLAVLMPVPLLLLFLGKSKDKDVQRKRKARMEAQYPDIVTKLSLLIGAGMTPYNALYRVASDGQGDAYDELRQVVAQIESGSSPVKEYALMGKRFGLQCYSKLGSMFGQNHTKGNEYFRNMLREEAYEAMEDRKSRAKKAGERAGTLMLIPMIAMLAVVMAMVMVPAFMSF